MGLDARVYCNCVETDQLLTPHPFPESLYIDAGGCPDIRSEEVVTFTAHDDWFYSSPCRHDTLTLLHYRLGNIDTVPELRRIVTALSEDSEAEYPVLWSKVIYSGIHCGDRLEVDEVRNLKVEIVRLSSRKRTQIVEKYPGDLQLFLEQMSELIAVSLSVNKPISF